MSRCRYVFSLIERMQLLEAAAELVASGNSLLLASAGQDDFLWLLVAQLHYSNLLRLATSFLSMAVTRGAQRDAEYAVHSWHYFSDSIDFQSFFRFKADEMERLFTAFKIPDTLWHVERNGKRRRVDGRHALTVLLWRLSSGDTLPKINLGLGRKRTAASRMCCTLLNWLFGRWYRPLFASDLRRWVPHYPRWAEAVWRKQQEAPGAHGRGHRNIVAFIDGNLNEVARPDALRQEAVYNNQHKEHGMKFLGMYGVNGLILDIVGGVEGRHNDQWLLGVGELAKRWDAHLQWACTRTMTGVYNGTPFNVQGSLSWHTPGYIMYGDAGFNLQAHLQVPYKASHGELGPLETELNAILSRARIPNEWIFGRMHRLWPVLKQENIMVLGKGYVTKYVIAAAMFTNAYTCLYGFQGNSYFGVLPPALEEYLDGAPDEAVCPRPWYEYAAEYEALDPL